MKKREWQTVWKADIEVDMRVEALEAPDKIVLGGQPHKMFRFVTSNNRDAAVVIVERKNTIALVKQNRFSIGQISLELPQGMGDKEDKDPVVTGMREASEELGVEVKNGVNIGNLYADSAITANNIHIISCEYVSNIGLGDGEVLSQHWVTKSEVLKLIKENKIKDGISIAALFKYYLYK